jgi:signal transduction histidine kinase
MQLNRRLRSFATLTPSLMLGIALSLGVGLLCYFIILRTITNENEERFRSMARTAQYTVNARIKSYTTVLIATKSLFLAEPNVTREKFHRFYTGLNLDENYPAIEVLNYASWVPEADRDAVEAKVRRELAAAGTPGPPFTIHPPGRRPLYAPVLFVEPQARWAHTFGYDINSIPVHLKALEDARDSGLISGSGTPAQPMRNKRNLGLALRLPVYRVGAPVDTVEQRRAAYIGSAGVGFSIKRLFNGVLDELPLKSIRLSVFNYIQTINPSDPAPSQLIYDSSASDANPEPPQVFDDPTQFHVALPVDFNGRTWTAHFTTPKKAVYRASDSSFPLLGALAGFTTTLLLYVLFQTLTTSRARAVELARGMTSELRESQSQLLLSHEKLRQLAAHAEHIKETERKRIAREIHDDLGQNLLALRIEAQLLFSRTGEQHPRLHARAETTLAQIDTTIKSVRQIINDLRPTVLDLGLNAAVDWQITEFQTRTGIKCDLVEYHTDIVVGDNCATALFRILQESLTNVRRHALASWVRVDLRVESGLVRMSIRDNGIGLQSGGYKQPGKFGLIGIEERVTMLGGTFSLSGSPGGGTTVEVAIPVRQENSDNRPEMDDIRPEKHDQSELV